MAGRAGPSVLTKLGELAVAVFRLIALVARSPAAAEATQVGSPLRIGCFSTYAAKAICSASADHVCSAPSSPAAVRMLTLVCATHGTRCTEACKVFDASESCIAQGEATSMSVDGGGASSGSAADSVPGSPAQPEAPAGGPPVAASASTAAAMDAAAPPPPPPQPLQDDTLLALLRLLTALAQAASSAWGATLPRQVSSLHPL